jgi:hypothetical protein
MGDMRGYFHRLGYWGFIIRLILLRNQNYCILKIKLSFFYFFISFCFLFVSFHFLHISLFRFAFVGFVSFRFHFVDFVSFRFVFVDFVSFRFVSFLFRFTLYRYPCLYPVLHIWLIITDLACLSVTVLLTYTTRNSIQAGFTLSTNFQKFKCHIFIYVFWNSRPTCLICE